MARLISHLPQIARACPQAAERALHQTGADILNVAQQLVPKDTTSLMKSGGVVPVNSQTIQVGFGAQGEYFAKAGEKPRQPSEYAAYVEYGTSRMGSQPYLTPAFLQSEETFKARIAQEMKKINGVD